MCIGMAVVEDDNEFLGEVSDILIHPDSGKIEGFFVSVSSFLRSTVLFCPSMDIVHIGTTMCVRSEDALCDPEELIRLQPLLSDVRSILGQSIHTENGARLGRCHDVQFHTKHLCLTWLFPRKWFWWGEPIPAKDIVEVRPAAIIIRERSATISEPEESWDVLDLPEVTGVAPS